ncbi:MAG: sensor histidine kinase [Gammaproteobacteria bacterium]
MGSNTDKDYNNYRRPVAIAILGWIVLSLLIAPGVYLDGTWSDFPLSVNAVLGQAFTASLAWGVVTFLVLVLNQWTRNRKHTGTVWLGRELLLGVVMIFILLLLMRWWLWPVLGLADVLRAPNLGAAVRAGLPRGFAIYLGVWGICQIILLLPQYARVKHQLVNSELRRLRNQLNPHFLFNTLNAISELAYEDPEAADRTITQMSGLLRKSLDNSNQQEIALRGELDFLQRYLAIQETLLRERLHVELEINDDTLNARVPGMILQPLVENAVTHGIGRTGTGCVTVRAARKGELLVIEVEDNGWGLVISEPRGNREGIGIANTRARLQYLYGDLASLELRSHPGEGLTAQLNIPFHEAYAFNEDPYPDR